MDGLENIHDGPLIDGANFGGHVGLKADFLRRASIALGTTADLIHGEAAVGNYLIERDTLAALAEVLPGVGHGAAVYLGEFIVVIVNHYFEQLDGAFYFSHLSDGAPLKPTR